MIHLIIDPAYAQTVWGRALRDGLKKALRRKRRAAAESDELPALCAADPVFLIHSDPALFAREIAQCNGAGVVPILLAAAPQSHPGRYHCVHADPVGALIDLAQTARAALYGVNPDSATDRALMDGLFAAAELPVYWNRTSLRACYEDYARRAADPDCVICTNDFTAVSLLRYLRADRAPIPRLISAHATPLAPYYQPEIESLPFDCAPLCDAAAALMDFAAQHPEIAAMTAAIAAPHPPRPVPSAAPRTESAQAFYADPELQRMMRVGRLLSQFDGTDRALLPMLLRGDTYDAMAAQSYLSKSTLQYRLRHWMDVCGVTGKAELAEVLRECVGELDNRYFG